MVFDRNTIISYRRGLIDKISNQMWNCKLFNEKGFSAFLHYKWLVHWEPPYTSKVLLPDNVS